MQVFLIGTGPGDPECLTGQACRALAESVAVIGAPRLIAAFAGEKPAYSANTPQEMAEAILRLADGPAAVLLSGDCGFFSAATRLRGMLAGHELVNICGVGSMQMFAACLGMAWEDFYPMSLHGRAGDPIGTVRTHRKTFLLTGGEQTPDVICQKLCAAGLGELRVSVGERLSYPDKRIRAGTAQELAEERFAGLAVLLVENPHPLGSFGAPGLPDDCFIRGKTPMTKSEVRAVILSKLRPQNGETLYDVGAGTGSVAVELAMQSPDGIVYAIEREADARDLIAQNRVRFGCENLQLVAGEAPDAFAELPPPDAVFIGGSGNRLREILSALHGRNPAVRVVIAAITLETIAEADCCLHEQFSDVQMVQLSVSRAEPLGAYRMLKAQNPVTLFAARGRE